jgi:phosphoribosylaminoimidazolecarboxamide formyltransferase/IMP cyclohydrolase
MKPDVRVLCCGSAPRVSASLALTTLTGGLLAQDADGGSDADGTLRVVTRRKPKKDELADLKFAWRVVRFVKSNAIVIAKDGQTIGIGAGQMSRIMSTRIAGMQAREFGFDPGGAVLASDAFFPFRDNVDLAAELGVRAIVQPGGSRKDAEVIAAANEHGIAMALTDHRHFRH